MLRSADTSAVVLSNGGTQGTMEKLELPVEDLILDLANPRLGGVATQAEALRGLIGLGVTYFRNMMVSIKKNGLDPGDSFYVLEDDFDESTYIVVDGNRRLAALKALAEPAVLSGLGLPDGQLKMLTSAASGFDPTVVDLVSCVMFDDRETADDWIERRHGRDLAGEGRLTWNPLEIERFQKDRSTLDVIGFVERNSAADQAGWPAVRTAVEKNSSTLRRFLSSKVGRRWLGYSVATEGDGSKVPAFARAPEFVLAVLQRIFADIQAGDINSRNYNTAEDIESYFESLPSGMKPTGNLASNPVQFRTAELPGSKGKQASSSQAQGKAAPTKTSRAKPPRLQLAEKKHAFRQPLTTKGQRLVYEASRIRVRDFPLASAYLLRAFLEHTVDVYMDANGIGRVDGKMLLDLNKRAVKVMDHLVQNQIMAGQALHGAKRVLTTTTDPASIQALNDYHHDRYQVPAADVLRNGWEACVPLFVAVYGPAE